MNNIFIKPDILNKNSLAEIDCISKKYKHYKKAQQELQEQYTEKDVKKIIENSTLSDNYVKNMQEFNTSILYKSDGHGINHNVRVSFFAFIISTNEGISNKDFELIIEACKYHDIGRENDLEDKEHGKKSAEKLTFLKDKYSEEELNYLKTIITCHSLNDKEFEKIASKNKIKDIERCKKMHQILKDSDGLDRVRLHYPYVNIKYLRTNTAKRMILFAHKIFNNYIRIINN